MMLASCLLLAFALHTSAFPTRRACTTIFDGKIASSVQAADFDTDSSVYNNGAVHGQNQTFADIISFPDVTPSLFDMAAGTKSFEVTLSDDSIFVPGSGPQFGFRRTELIPAINTGASDDITVQGTTTFHWSLRSDPSKPLNLSHEYQLVHHETNDFSTNQFLLRTGTPFNQTFVESEHKTLRLEGRQTARQLLFSTPFDDDVWHNFALTVAWDANKITIFYSRDLDPLQVVNVTKNDNSGLGQQHYGNIKLPIGDAGIDVVHEGFQESGINEGIFYGSIFIEDSSDGCLSLS